jgi:hypothetical protein
LAATLIVQCGSLFLDRFSFVTPGIEVKRGQACVN